MNIVNNITAKDHTSGETRNKLGAPAHAFPATNSDFNKSFT